jgi:hypothetical protein
VGYVLPSEVLADLRVFLQRDTGAREALVKRHALDLLGQLARTDGLDSERLHELATWAREQARAKDKLLASAPPGETERVDAAFGSDFTGNLRRKQAETARIIEVSTDVLTALALDKLPPGAVLNIGRDEQQVNAKPALDVLDPGPAHLRWPDADERAFMGRMAAMVEQATSGEPGPGEAMFMRIGANLGLGDELAANGKMSRAQVEALPSHDRVVLGQILATLRGGTLTREPLEGPAVDVLVELDTYLRSLAAAMQLNPDTDAAGLVRMATQWTGVAQHARGEVAQRDEWIRDIAEHLGLDRNRVRYQEVIDAAEAAGEATVNPAPLYSLPESHPLRQYQWAEWLAALIRREEAVEGSDYITGSDERLPVLREALARVQSHDVNGLRGLYADSGEFWPDENVLLQVALGIRESEIAMSEGGAALTRGCHRVPRVRGETAEVGK